MFRVTDLRMKNIGPYTKLDIKFPNKQGLILICGSNGIGKTTILNSIVAAFSVGNNSALRKREGSDQGRVELEFFSNSIKQMIDIDVDAFSATDENRIYPSVTGYSKYIINIKSNRDIFYSRKDSIDKFPVYNEHSNSVSLDTGLQTNQIKDWFINRFILNKVEGYEYSEWQVNNRETAIGFFNLLDRNVSLKTVDPNTYEIMVSTSTGVIPYEYLSSGFRSAYILLLGILKEIEFRGINVEAKNYSGLIVIDEIDLHLHPEWQQRIGSILKQAFPCAQIIATTHSPHVVQAAEPEEVFVLSREDDGSFSACSEVPSKYGYAGWTIEEVLEYIMGVTDTKTLIYREAIKAFDDAIADENCPAVQETLDVLLEMLHPNNHMRRILAIRAAPFTSVKSEGKLK